MRRTQLAIEGRRQRAEGLTHHRKLAVAPVLAWLILGTVPRRFELLSGGEAGPMCG